MKLSEHKRAHFTEVKSSHYARDVRALKRNALYPEITRSTEFTENIKKSLLEYSQEQLVKFLTK